LRTARRPFIVAELDGRRVAWLCRECCASERRGPAFRPAMLRGVVAVFAGKAATVIRLL
jgi:hypothetical protein